MKQYFVRWANSVWDNACAALFCMLVFRLFMCLILQHDNRWRQLSFGYVFFDYVFFPW